MSKTLKIMLPVLGLLIIVLIVSYIPKGEKENTVEQVENETSDSIENNTSQTNTDTATIPNENSSETESPSAPPTEIPPPGETAPVDTNIIQNPQPVVNNVNSQATPEETLLIILEQHSKTENQVYEEDLVVSSVQNNNVQKSNNVISSSEKKQSEKNPTNVSLVVPTLTQATQIKPHPKPYVKPDKNTAIYEKVGTPIVSDASLKEILEDSFENLNSLGSDDFKNCSSLNSVYPNGVEKGHDAYQTKLDRDSDGWACEKN